MLSLVSGHPNRITLLAQTVPFCKGLCESRLSSTLALNPILWSQAAASQVAELLACSCQASGAFSGMLRVGRTPTGDQGLQNGTEGERERDACMYVCMYVCI